MSEEFAGHVNSAILHSSKGFSHYVYQAHRVVSLLVQKPILKFLPVYIDHLHP